MGWEDIGSYIDKGSLVFLEAGGKDLPTYQEEPPSCQQWKARRHASSLTRSRP
jgi:hypothetical protein